MRVRLQTLSLLFLLLVSLNTRAAQWTVEIYDFYFTPTNLTVGLGDTVTWINRVTRAHDTTQFDPNNPDLLLWASDLLSKDQSFSYTFTSLGTFPYVCAVHFAQHPEQTGTVSVAQANLPPSVSITNPANGALFNSPASFSISGSATDHDGSVVNVDFFLNGTSVGVSQGPAFTANVNALTAGNYAITAVALDNLGAASTSAPVNISVEGPPMKFPLTISVQPPDAGSVAASPLQPIDGYGSGAVVTLTASPANGFVFAGWSGDANGTANPLTLTIDSARNVTANFTPSTTPSFALTVITNPVGAGRVTIVTAPNGPNGTYLEGTSVTMTAFPSPESVFTNWTGDAISGTETLQIEMRSNTVVTANFVVTGLKRFTLTVNTVPPNLGIVIIDPPPGLDQRYAEGTVITLAAMPLGLAEFLGWSGDVSATTNRISFVMTTNKVVTGTFAPVQPGLLLILAPNPPGSGTILVSPVPRPNGTYAPGTTIAAAAVPNSGFRFVHWIGFVFQTTNNPFVFTTPPSAITARDPLFLTAVFEPIPTLEFATAAGKYAGLLLDEPAVNSSTNLGTEYATLGFLSVRVTRTGAYRGTATVGGIRQSIVGQFDRFGYAPLVMRRGTLSGSLQIDSAGGRITGLLTDGSSAPTLLLYRAMDPTNAIAFAGDYPLMFGVNDVVTTEGKAILRLSKQGVARLRGRLGDGTAFTTRTFLSRDARLPVFVPLYGKRGAILGWLDAGANGSVRWLRPGDSRSRSFPNGFVLEVPILDGSETAFQRLTNPVPFSTDPFCRPGPLNLTARKALLASARGSRSN